jgi:hypothetical protein
MLEERGVLMKLTLKTILLVVGPILAVLIGIIYQELKGPDIRYEEGSYYISGAMAVTSLKLRNFGRSDAEDITITAKFPKPLLDISINDRSMKFVSISGGKGQNIYLARFHI